MNNKIQIKKSKPIPRHHIIYHYKKSKSVINAPKPKAISKPRNNMISVARPKHSINSKLPSRIASMKITRPIKSNVRSVSVKPTFRPKQKSRRKNTFDSRLPKIRSIEGIGKGKILVILAPGPSILEAEINKLIDIPNVDTMTINKPDKRCWPSDYWMFCDRTQYTRNKEEFRKFKKTIINTDSIKQAHPRQIKLKNLSGKGFSKDMTKGFYIGRSTTFSAMQVAAWMGYEKIFIFGLDMCRVGKKLHSYGKNPDVPEKIREKRFKKEAEFYDVAAKIIDKELCNKYYICSSYNKWPFVKKFNRLDQKEAIEHILECAKEI